MRRPSGRGLLAACLVLAAAPLSAQPRLSADDVRAAVARAASASSAPAWIAVTDTRGKVLGLFRTDGARDATRVEGQDGQGLEGAIASAGLVAVTKAGTGAFLSSGGNAFTTRTASFIVQEHFPPGIEETAGGPLFGVQFSNLPCSDVQRLPYGLSGDPGGVPLYRGGVVVGGLGVEIAEYGVDKEPEILAEPDDAVAEEAAALAGQRGLEPPAAINAERIYVDGVRLPYANTRAAAAGTAAPAGRWIVGPREAASATPAFPTRGGAGLSAADVAGMLSRATEQAARTRAAIREPLGDHARVSIAVVDVDGTVLGFVRTDDAPAFGVDVSVQKARTAAFFSSPAAGAALRGAGLTLPPEVPLDGSVALSTRAIGFLAQPFFPPGIPDTAAGPLSRPANEWSPFNTGLQLELVLGTLGQVIALGPGPSLQAFVAADGVLPLACSRIPALGNGITLFPGGIPLYRDGRLVGAIGVSGDGVDQDDLIAAAGAIGFEPSEERRSDRVLVRGVRLPWLKFPRHPEL